MGKAGPQEPQRSHSSSSVTVQLRASPPCPLPPLTPARTPTLTLGDPQALAAPWSPAASELFFLQEHPPGKRRHGSPQHSGG